MSVAVRRAIYGKLAGDTTLTGMLGTPAANYNKAIYFQIAPEGASFPYVIFQKQAGTPRWAIGAKAFDNEVWTVKGVDKDGSGDAVDGIASRLDALLSDGTISISGSTQLYLRRESDVEYPEVRDGSLYRHSGAQFRLVYQSP